jgi:hypothetical protein
MKKPFVLLLVPLVFGLSQSAFADDECAGNLQEVEAMIGHDFHSSWRETSARDKKPMHLRITERGEKLHIVFEKTDDGIWGSGRVEVCKKGSKYEIVATDMVPGDAADGLIRGMMKGTQKFDLKVNSASSIRVSRVGWGGNFEPGQ